MKGSADDRYFVEIEPSPGIVGSCRRQPAVPGWRDAMDRRGAGQQPLPFPFQSISSARSRRDQGLPGRELGAGGERTNALRPAAVQQRRRRAAGRAAKQITPEIDRHRLQMVAVERAQL